LGEATGGVFDFDAALVHGLVVPGSLVGVRDHQRHAIEKFVA